jgi:hypothetical protein
VQPWPGRKPKRLEGRLRCAPERLAGGCNHEVLCVCALGCGEDWLRARLRRRCSQGAFRERRRHKRQRTDQERRCRKPKGERLRVVHGVQPGFRRQPRVITIPDETGLTHCLALGSREWLQFEWMCKGEAGKVARLCKTEGCEALRERLLGDRRCRRLADEAAAHGKGVCGARRKARPAWPQTRGSQLDQWR